MDCTICVFLKAWGDLKLSSSLSSSRILEQVKKFSLVLGFSLLLRLLSLLNPS